jgi:hypothetical protein
MTDEAAKPPAPEPATTTYSSSMMLDILGAIIDAGGEIEIRTVDQWEYPDDCNGVECRIRMPGHHFRGVSRPKRGPNSFWATGKPADLREAIGEALRAFESAAQEAGR